MIMQKTDDFSRACQEIMENLLTIDNPTTSVIKNEIKNVCTKYSLERFPRNNEILSMANPLEFKKLQNILLTKPCLLYTSPSPRDLSTSRMPSSA